MFKTYKLQDSLIKIYRVAGCVEIPVILKGLAENKQYDCLVAIGAVVRGETPHFDYVAKIVSEGILKIMLNFGIPVGFGILTTDNIKQAQARTSVGGAAVEAALQNARLLKEIAR
ncbi:MAG: 6,7-dimethyl-8-ribityllumazine synthase, partial [Patescibacteria group bacterium]